MIYNISREAELVFGGKQCNSYLITGDKNILIDTAPEMYSPQYIAVLKKYINPEKIDAIFLLSADPVRSGCVSELLKINRNISVYATVAGLKMLKDVLNHDFNGVMCKNRNSITIGNDVFSVVMTPNLTWPDSMMLLYENDNALFSGELCSALNGSKKEYYNAYLRGCEEYIAAAICALDMYAPDKIYPAFGGVEDNNLSYDGIIELSRSVSKNVLVVYASKTGYNKKLAEAVAKQFKDFGISAKAVSAENVNIEDVYKADGLVVGTYTEKKSMPPQLWDLVSSFNPDCVKRKPYFVFGSYGWSCEGAYMLNEILHMLKMKRVCKMFECIMNPGADEINDIKKSVEEFAHILLKCDEERSNA